MVHDIQREPVSGNFLHIDFYAITKGEKVHTKIPLLFTWDSIAVKEWAILEEHIKEIEVKVLPNNLVDNIEVNISWLKEIGDSIRISDLNIDLYKFDLITIDSVVVSANKPKIEEIPTDAPSNDEVTGADTEEGTKEDVEKKTEEKK